MAAQPPAPRPSRDPAVASILDAVAFVRHVVGSDASRRVEVLLALLGGVEADVVSIARLLVRDRSSVAKELAALQEEGLVARRGARNHAQRFQLTADGERQAASLRDQLVRRAQELGGYDEFFAAAQPRMATPTGAGPSPVRMPLPVATTPRRTTAERLKLCRGGAGLTQRELARAASVSLTTLQRIEEAQLDPPVYALRRCAMALGLRLVDLLHPA